MSRLLWATVLLAGPVDILLSLSNWHLETNPVALWLGPVGLVAVKAVALAALVLLSYRTSVNEHPVGRACLCALCALYAVVALTNLAVLTV